MKKKIKDVIVGELNRACDDVTLCDECLLRKACDAFFDQMQKDDKTGQIIDLEEQEIEVPDKRLMITSKIGEELNFLDTGIDGVYVLDHAAFKNRFDEGSNNYWDASTGKKLLQKWAEDNLPKKILNEFNIDIPYVEEVFSQKMISLYELGRKFKFKQFPVFQNSDNRMMKYDGKPISWWTRSVYHDFADGVWYVQADGGTYCHSVYSTIGFVPVLRRKK